MTTVAESQLDGLLDRYFEALHAGDPSKLPLGPSVTFTENGHRLELDQGLWFTVEAAGARRALEVRDVEAGQVAGWGLAREAGEEVLVGARLRLDGDDVSEIETVVVRPVELGHEGRPFPPALHAEWGGFQELVPVAARGSRADLIAAADGYLDGVAGNDAEIMPVADDCIRIENGLQTVLNPDAAGFPPELAADLSEGLGLGVRDQIRRGTFTYIQAIRDRRFIAVDEARGVVLVSCFFDHPGQRRGATAERFFRSPNSMMIWEVFKVEDGLIRHIEAIGGRFSLGLRPGWA